ncbi:MAG: Na/Pi cotransporter family protein [Chromatiaceae bacterium]|jgi:phosphate:Na+ symporter|nr:Na/Pi cotransporter family protein [Chromatiaceae bacterium]
MLAPPIPSRTPLPALYAFVLGVFLLGVASVAWAGGEEEGIDWAAMGMNLLGGLAVFLYGMELMAGALKKVAGDSMKQILARLTNSRIMGLITGALVTAIIQSSSVTTVMLVGFVTAGLMSLSQAIGVILGADIGTTVTAQIVAFKVTKYALLLVAVGFGLIFLGKKDRVKQYGYLIMGLGMIFFGMGIMSEGMSPLRSYDPFIALMRNVSNPVIGILVATFFTALVQSSSATMGVVIAMALQGLISLEAGIALALGANIGTCATAGLAAIGKPREAVRVAVAHVSFKIVGVILIFPFIPYLAELVRDISPAAASGLVGMDKLAAETPRQIANAHTIFNVGIATLFLPLAGQFARLVEYLVPDTPLELEVGAIVKPRYLDEALLSTPSLALDRVRLEILHMGETIDEMLAGILPAIVNRDRQRLTEIQRLDDSVDLLHSQILVYMGLISKGTLSDTQTAEFLRLMEAVNDLENIGDIVESGMVVAGYEVVDKGIRISPSTEKVLSEFHDAVVKTVSNAVQAVSQNNEQAAEMVTTMKQEIQDIVASTAAHLAERMVADEPNRIPTYSVEVDLLEKLKRIYYFAKRMAKTVEAQAQREAEVA